MFLHSSTRLRKQKHSNSNSMEEVVEYDSMTMCSDNNNNNNNNNTNWLIDYPIIDDAFFPPQTFTFTSSTSPPPILSSSFASSNASLEVCSFGDSEDFVKDTACRKRFKPENSAFGSKACREKQRRDKLNERFLQLSSVLDPERPPKTDKAAVLSDAVRTVIQLRIEAQKLKESNEDLQEKVKELKAEKNELRDEKQRLKEDKEKLEQQLKGMSIQHGYLSHPSAISAAFAARGQTVGSKLMPYIGFPSVAMWQFMPPSAIDTSQDHILRPPVA